MLGHLRSPIVLVYSRALSTILTLGYTVILARELGPEGRGITAAIFALGAIMPSIFGVGLPLAARRRTKRGKQNAAFSGSVKVLASTAPLSVLVAGAISLLFESLVTRPELIAIAILLCLTPLFVLGRVLQQILLGRKNYLRQASSNVSLALGNFTCVIAIWLFGNVTILAAVLAQTAGMLFTFLTAFFLAKPSWQGSPVSDLLKEARAYWVRDAIRELRERADQLLVLPIFGPVNAGIYSVAVMVARLPLVFSGAIGVMAFHSVQEKTLSLQVTVAAHLKASLTIVISSSALIALLSPWLVPLIFGQEFRESISTTILIALVLTPLLSVLTILENIFNLLGKEREIAMGETVLVLVGILGTVAFSETLGINAVVIFFSLGALGTTAIWLRKLRIKGRHCRPRLADYAVLTSLFKNH